MVRNPIGRVRRVAGAVFVLACGLAGPAAAQNTLPTGGHVVAGSATIGAPAGNTLTVNQGSNRAVVNWNSFSVGQPNAVDFVQPGSSAAILNRVTGGTPSSIAGQINANGQVYLVNPNGIAITPTGSVQVGGGFVASTLGITNSNFMSGNLAFTGNGASAGVSNAGSIAAGSGGYVGLIGGTVANSGVISVPLGKVALGSGEEATLDLNGDGFMQVAVPTGTTTAKGRALVSNSGRINAAGGTVELRAATVATAIRDAVNMSGVIAANSVSWHDGAITLGGGPGGAVNVTGTLDASAPLASSQPPANGGSITVAGARVRIGHHTVLNASGARGGSVLVGVTGPGGVGEAQSTTIASGAQILAEGNNSVAGSGGTIETSGGTLKLGKATISAGRGGSWLTDPDNLIIDSTAATTIDNALAAGTNVTEQTTATVFSGVGNVVTGGNGDIDVVSALSWSTGATLTLSAYNNITVSAPITVSGGGTLVLTYNNASANPNAALAFVMGQGSAQFTSESSGPSLYISSGSGTAETAANQYRLIYNLGTGLDGIQILSSSSGNFALATPIDASTDPNITLPLSTSLIGTFSGNFNGLGNTVSNLTITDLSTTDTVVGMFEGLNSGGTISNFGLVNASVSASFTNANFGVGSLAGGNLGTITNSYATGTVTGSGTGSSTEVLVGGLVGTNLGGTIANSYAAVAVSIPTPGVCSTGPAACGAGGLVGANAGTITNSEATGAVSTGPGTYTSTGVGGLAGINGSGAITITTSLATGGVSSSGTGATLGGLVGISNGSGAITNSYYDSTTTGQPHGTQSDGSVGSTTAELAGASVLTALNSSGTVWGNVNNQVTPYILTNPSPVFVGSDTVLSTLVFTPIQLQNINNNLSGHYVLAQDIDMTGATGFTPIGNSTTAFSGTFNGLGNVVANLTINDSTDLDVGLFGITSGSSISNLGLINASVSATTAPATVGGLVGSNNGTITNSYVTGAVGSNQTPSIVGGLVGLNFGTIVDAYATAAVSAGNVTNAGGLVGLNEGPITDAYATGAVTGGNVANVGGLVGNNSSTITNVYAAGAVSAGTTSNIAGLVAVNFGAITNGYSDADRSAVGTQVVRVNSGTLVSVSTLSGTQPFTATAYSGFTFTATPGTAQQWVLVDTDGTLNNGTGTTAGATLPMLAFEAQSTIQNAHQLQLIAMNPAGGYTLGRNIDAMATGSSIGPATGTDVWTSTGFVPILSLTGSFNGLSSSGAVQTITNLTINNSASIDVGLIGTNFGSISNVGLSGGSITGTTVPTINGTTAVGALVGLNAGSISNSYATASVSFDGHNNGAGGLVGDNFTGGSITNSYSTGTVTGGIQGAVGGLVAENAGGAVGNSYATGTVTGGDQSTVGGLVGVATSGAITNSYATGSVTGGANLATIGGLVGSNAVTISNSYANGSVTGAAGSLVGGLAGDNTGTINTSFAAGRVSGSNGDEGGLLGENAGTITDVYAVGAVIGTNATVGGLVGVNTQTGTVIDAYATGALIISGGHAHGLVGTNVGTITDGYYDAGTTGQALGTQVDGSIGLTTAQLQGTPGVAGVFNLATDFQNPSNWGIIAGKSYPYLCWQFGGCGATPQAVSGTVYKDLGGISAAGPEITVTAFVNGSQINSVLSGGTVSTGANGYYYYLLAPNTIPAFRSVLTFAQNYSIGGGQTASGATLSPANGASATGVNILANSLYAITDEPAYSAVVSDLDTAAGLSGPAATLANGLQNLRIDASGAFSVDAMITHSSGTVTLNADGAISQTLPGAITAGTLTGSSAGDTVLTNPTNFVQNLGAFSTTTGGANGNFTLLLAGGNAFNIIGALNAGTGTVSLTNPGSFVASGITEQTGGSITAGTLTGSAGGSAFFQQPGNHIANLGPFTEIIGANFALTDAQSLTVSGTLNAGSGFIFLTTTGTGSNLALHSSLTASGNTVSLVSAGTISQTGGIITANTLTGSSVGGASMPNGNSVANFGAWSDTGAGSTGLKFTDGVTLTTAGTISSTGPIFLSAINEPDLILNTNINSGGTLALFANGNISQTGGGITAPGLIAVTQLDAGGSITLNSATNAITGNATLTSLITAGTALAGGAISLTDGSSITIASLGGLQTGVATTGAASVVDGGNLTIAASALVTGGGVALAAAGNFVNNEGADAVTATGGNRWLVYSNAPATDTFGNLNSGNTAIWGATFASLPPASVTASGNRYIFAQGQTLTITTTNASKVYGQEAVLSFTESGFASGVANAFLADTPANVVTGSPNVTSAGFAADASVVGGPYPIVATAGSLTLESGYSLVFVNTGQVTVTPAPLTASITGNPTKVYDGTTTAALASGNFALSGFVGADGATVSALTGAYASSNVGTGIGVSANLVGGEFTANAGTLLSNYTLPTTASATGTISPRPITVTADNLTRPFDQPNPPLTFMVTAGNLVTGDVLSGGLATTALVDSPAAAYPITQGALTATSNYVLTFIGGTLVVMPGAPVPVVTPLVDFGVSPDKYIPPTSTAEISPSSLTACSAADLAAMLERTGNAVIFGPEPWICGGGQNM